MKYEIGNKIRRFREKRGLSQKELAMRIGVSNSRISNWEQGINRPDANILAKLCKSLDVSADELLDINLSAEESNSDKVNIFPTPSGLRIAYLYDRASDTDKKIIELMLEKYNVPPQSD